MNDRERFFRQVSQILKDRYCISLEDTGYETDEWLNRFGDLPAEEAVECFATKYGLTSLDT